MQFTSINRRLLMRATVFNNSFIMNTTNTYVGLPILGMSTPYKLRNYY
jgi:hypothetical protein